MDQLPQPFLNYIDFIEKAVEVPITILSVGPDRSQTIIRHADFKK
jgi:adenylosuccinate synthase